MSRETKSRLHKENDQAIGLAIVQLLGLRSNSRGMFMTTEGEKSIEDLGESVVMSAGGALMMVKARNN